jgi:hypothetical protein
MNIKSIDSARYGNGKWDLSVPGIRGINGSEVSSYIVQKDEDMRIDLVMKSIYDESYDLSDIDIILYINDIDNPLNIREGMVLYYPPSESLDDFRYYEIGNVASNKSIKQRLGVLNKTTRVDEKRKKFLDANYSLPPVVLQETKAGVTIGPSTIKVGGL